MLLLFYILFFVVAIWMGAKLLCLLQGGKYQKWGLAQLKYCQIPAHDAGNLCRDGGECSVGMCLAKDAKSTQGKCATFKNTFGCHAFLTNGKNQGMICID